MRLIANQQGLASSPFLYRDKREYMRLKMALHQEGFRYRFPLQAPSQRHSTVSPQPPHRGGDADKWLPDVLLGSGVDAARQKQLRDAAL